MLTKTGQNYVSLLEEKICQEKASIANKNEREIKRLSEKRVKYAQNFKR
jgi:hypothetical protein